MLSRVWPRERRAEKIPTWCIKLPVTTKHGMALGQPGSVSRILLHTNATRIKKRCDGRHTGSTPKFKTCVARHSLELEINADSKYDIVFQ